MRAWNLIIFLFKGYTQQKDLDEKDVDGSSEMKLEQNILKTEKDKMKKKKILSRMRDPGSKCKIMIQHHNFPLTDWVSLGNYGLQCPLFLNIKYHRIFFSCIFWSLTRSRKIRFVILQRCCQNNTLHNLKVFSSLSQ